MVPPPQTTRLLDHNLSVADRQIAAKVRQKPLLHYERSPLRLNKQMVIHFVGDIGQPLHCENLETGGNGIDVEYDGDSTNLHHIWDSEIPESVAGGSSMSAAKAWATTLATCV